MQDPTMARSTYTYSFELCRQKIFETCRRLPSEKHSRICTMVSMWEPEKVTQTADGFECDIFSLEKSTLRRISTLLSVFKLQEGTEHPMTHVQPSPRPPFPLAPPSRLLPFLTLSPPVSPLPPSPPPTDFLLLPTASLLQSSASSAASPEQQPTPAAPPEQPPTSPATGAFKMIIRRVNAYKHECVTKENGLTEEKPKAASKRKAVNDKRSKENKRPRIQMDPRLRRMLDRKEPKMAQNKKDDGKRFQENAIRAKLAMEKRRMEKK
ncbi:hypothetical protein AVEN_23359-2 [Araneus ventricosus]|uniref:Uncharacterized protein n=1 Tax=Araneus ventricosus TaxID=182803 RepID=A0A4Y2N291_ARAVE|nr:hypothetical protein AVEN_23359-2 [Araneus ventricosus]